MVAHSSLHSPSFHKSPPFADNRRGVMSRASLGNIVGDPFALTSLSISLLAWLITFISSVIAKVQTEFANFHWWAITYSLLCIIGAAFVMSTASSHVYGTAMVGYATGGMVLTTWATDALITSQYGARQAAGAGFILLSMTFIVWIFYFGSSPQSHSRGYIDSFAMQKEQPSYLNNNQRASTNFGTRPATTVSQPPQMYTSAQLGGFETSSPMAGFGGNSATPPVGATVGNSQPNAGANATSGGEPNEVTQPTEYPYRAKAIYSYEANPDDANEISFTKHEILEVSDVSGRWWQAKKSTGETGIAPSNYLILL